MEEIKHFIENRPNVVAAYAYGSKVFNQKDADSKNSLIDLIFVVDDIKRWHLDNIKKNSSDYTKSTAKFFENADINKIKGNTGIVYISDIKENNLKFKYGTIEYQDLLLYLQTWKSFYMPGRFQKTICPYKEDIELKEAINNNRYKALIVATYLHRFGVVSKYDLIKTIISLSYLGDTRMKFAENNGAYDEYLNIYNFNSRLFKDLGDDVIINESVLYSEMKKIPYSLKEYIKNYNINNTRDCIIDYITNLNKKESIEMTKKGISTNGVVRSLKYASRKIEKRF